MSAPLRGGDRAGPAVAKGQGVLGRNELLLGAGLVRFPEFKPAAFWDFQAFQKMLETGFTLGLWCCFLAWLEV